MHDLTADDQPSGVMQPLDGRQLSHTQSLPAHSAQPGSNESSSPQAEAERELAPLQHAETAPGDLNSNGKHAATERKRRTDAPIGQANDHVERPLSQRNGHHGLNGMQDVSHHERNAGNVEVVADSESDDL